MNNRKKGDKPPVPPERGLARRLWLLLTAPRLLLVGLVLPLVLTVYAVRLYRLQVVGGSSRVDLQACKLGTGRRFTTS
jgi:hypothetical protein